MTSNTFFCGACSKIKKDKKTQNQLKATPGYCILLCMAQHWPGRAQAKPNDGELWRQIPPDVQSNDQSSIQSTASKDIEASVGSLETEKQHWNMLKIQTFTLRWQNTKTLQPILKKPFTSNVLHIKSFWWKNASPTKSHLGFINCPFFVWTEHRKRTGWPSILSRYLLPLDTSEHLRGHFIDMSRGHRLYLWFCQVCREIHAFSTHIFKCRRGSKF